VTSSRQEWAERWVELWNSGDVERWLDETGPDFEFTPDPSFPDAGSYRGEELRDWIHEWARIWGSPEQEQPTRMAAFFDRDQAELVASAGTG
jgi:hypothetical protein